MYRVLCSPHNNREPTGQQDGKSRGNWDNVVLMQVFRTVGWFSCSLRCVFMTFQSQCSRYLLFFCIN